MTRPFVAVWSASEDAFCLKDGPMGAVARPADDAREGARGASGELQIEVVCGTDIIRTNG
jgi:hypothetical protein